MREKDDLHTDSIKVARKFKNNDILITKKLTSTLKLGTNIL